MSKNRAVDIPVGVFYVPGEVPTMETMEQLYERRPDLLHGWNGEDSDGEDCD